MKVIQVGDVLERNVRLQTIKASALYICQILRILKGLVQNFGKKF